jgi:hypothetical protein
MVCCRFSEEDMLRMKGAKYRALTNAQDLSCGPESCLKRRDRGGPMFHLPIILLSKSLFRAMRLFDRVPE